VKSLTLEHERFSTNALRSVAVTGIKQKRSLVQEHFNQATSSALQSVEHCGPTAAQQSLYNFTKSRILVSPIFAASD
jgi:hypothetical protein